MKSKRCGTPLVVQIYGGGRRWYCPKCVRRWEAASIWWTNSDPPADRLCPRPVKPVRTRRNSDEDLRQLERRVLEGDLTLVGRLARAYERAGRGIDLIDDARSILRDNYWRDVRAVAREVASHGDDAIEALILALETRIRIRPFLQPQTRRRQGGWVTLPGWLETAVEATGRLSTSASIRETVEFSFRSGHEISDASARAEYCFLVDVQNEARRSLRGVVPCPLGTRLRVARELMESVEGEGIPDRVVAVGSTGTLVAVFHNTGSFSPCVRMDDYWADWGDTFDALECASLDEFQLDYEVIS